MNLADYQYCLAGMAQDGDKIYVTVDFLADARTKEAYLDQYFEGLYIGKPEEKYNVSVKKGNGRLTGELLYDTVSQNAVEKQGNLLRFWVRNRIGNIYIDQPVMPGKDTFTLSFGRKHTFTFTPVNDREFYFRNGSNVFCSQNPIRADGKDRNIIDAVVRAEEHAVRLSARCAGRLAESIADGEVKNVFCLAWKNVKTRQMHFFHEQQVTDGKIEYDLTREEINAFGTFWTDGEIFDWIMVDETDQEYALYAAEGEMEEPCILPADDLYAELMKTPAETFSMRMNTTMFFSYTGVGETGNEIYLEFKKRTYDLTFLSVRAQRVNTELEYELPFSVFREEKEKTIYRLKLEFDVPEWDFRTGVYQYWVQIKDGIFEERYPLKLFRERQIGENTYIAGIQPFTVIGGRAYRCLFYNDTSNNLKCNIVPAAVKCKVKETTVSETKIAMELLVKKEPYFERLAAVQLSDAKNKKEEVDFFCEDTDGMLSVSLSIPMKRFLLNGPDAAFRLLLCFGDGLFWIPLENNFYRPAVCGRETGSFSAIRQVAEKDYIRIWGDHRDGCFWTGCSENLMFLTADGCFITEDSLVIAFGLEDGAVPEEEAPRLHMLLKNKHTEELSAYETEWTKEGITCTIPVSGLKLAEFSIYGQLTNGKISYLAMRCPVRPLFFPEERKKLSFRNRDGFMELKADELLTYEDESRAAECLRIAEEARAECGTGNRKIWLVGENYGLSARDNGLAFFEYCMKNRDVIDAEVYFVSKETNEDGWALKEYPENVLTYDSAEHIYYDELAEFYIVSHGIRDVMPSLYHDRIGIYRKPVIYLQHGITAMKKIEMSNRSYGGSIRKFIVSSEQEKELLIKNGQFFADELAVTGFSRYDKLERTAEPNGGYLWIMPTWRDWLLDRSDFLNSDFYQYYSSVLSNDRLLHALRRSKQKILFSLHIEFEKYKHFFSEFECDAVYITDMHEKSIAERIKACGLMVTDYSSIIFDVVYTGKPAVFFQFDQAEYNRYRGSYVDFETELPGPVTHSPDELIDVLCAQIENGFTVLPEEKERAGRYFDFYDGKNSERICQAVLSCREEIADENLY